MFESSKDKIIDKLVNLLQTTLSGDDHECNDCCVLNDICESYQDDGQALCLEDKERFKKVVLDWLED